MWAFTNASGRLHRRSAVFGQGHAGACKGEDGRLFVAGHARGAAILPRIVPAVAKKRVTWYGKAVGCCIGSVTLLLRAHTRAWRRREPEFDC